MLKLFLGDYIYFLSLYIPWDFLCIFWYIILNETLFYKHEIKILDIAIILSNFYLIEILRYYEINLTVIKLFQIL